MPIGVFPQDAVKSFSNSTWHIQSGPVTATGRERSQNVAVFWRFGSFIPDRRRRPRDDPVAVPLRLRPRWGPPSSSRDGSARSGTTALTLRPDSAGTVLDWRFAAALGVALRRLPGSLSLAQPVTDACALPADTAAAGTSGHDKAHEHGDLDERSDDTGQRLPLMSRPEGRDRDGDGEFEVVARRGERQRRGPLVAQSERPPEQDGPT